MSALEQIDKAVQACRAAGHRHGLNPLAHKHLEFARAHLSAAWDAEDGLRAESPEATHEAIVKFYRMQERLAGKFAEAKARADEIARACEEVWQ